MSQSADEARAARIERYKEDRRKQLTARTATLFSANVTERRPKREAAGRSPLEDSAAHLKSSSELNINLASTSVPIRTTRTSRLRAAANTSDPCSSPKRSNRRSSSVQSLLEDDKTKTPKNSKILDRDKTRINYRRQSNEKENLKSASTTCFTEKENGAIRSKIKHSTNKNILEKDKSSSLLRSPKERVVDEKKSSKLDEKNKNLSTEESKVAIKDEETVDVDDILNDILGDNNVSNSLEKDRFEDLYHDLIVESNNIKIEVNKIVMEDNVSSCGNKLKLSHKNSYIPVKETVVNKNESVKGDKGVVPNVVKTEGGSLGAVCVRKVERFSELLSNLCSPCEADILFEDILVENGINGDNDTRAKAPECSAPCRRAPPAHPAPPAPPAPSGDADGTITKSKNRRTLESAHPKFETPPQSSKVSPKANVSLQFGFKSNCIKPNLVKNSEKRRSSESSSRPSCIPLSKKTPEKVKRKTISPIKTESVKDATSKSDNTKLKLESSRGRTLRKSPDKSKISLPQENSPNDRKHRAQKDNESLNEKYHNFKKRLTSLDNSSIDGIDIKNKNSKIAISESLKSNFDSDHQINELVNTKITNMSTLHESVRQQASSRLSQEMDSLAALTKQTLDRVNKLTNNLTNSKLPVLSTTEENKSNHAYNYGLISQEPIANRGVTERLKDIDTAAQRLIDFEKQNALFSDLNNDCSSQNRRLDNSSSSQHTPVSILKRKSIHEECNVTNPSNHAIASPPVTFSPSVIETRNCRSDNRQRQGILKKRRSLDESQVARRRSCSPEVSFADDGSSDTCKPILKNRRSSLEDVVRNRSPDGQIQGILKRKMSREEEYLNDDLSHGSPEPHGILKRKSNSSSSSSTTSSHVSIAQAVLLAAAGGAELVEEDKDTVRPILKKKSFSEERPSPDILTSETPKPILKKKLTEHDDHDFERPKKPILKSSKKLGDEGHTSSFDLSEDDRSSRRPSLLRSRTSVHSGSECETTVRPILKQRCSSLTRERSQSPRPRLSFCADNDVNISATNISSDVNDLLAAGPRRIVNLVTDPVESYPSAVIRRRNQRPKTNPRSISLVCDVNDELLSILNNRRLKVEENCQNGKSDTPGREKIDVDNDTKTFPSIASRIKTMEEALTKDHLLQEHPFKQKNRDKERYKTQPITIEEIRSIASSLEPGQANFQAFGIAGCSFPTHPVETGAALSSTAVSTGEPERDPFTELDSTSFDSSPIDVKLPRTGDFGEATFLDFEKFSANGETKQSTLEEIEQEVNKVRVALDEDCRALEEDESNQAEADNWSLNVSCDSGVYNRASSRDSGPHSGEELGLIESQEIRENHATNSTNDWSTTSIEQDLIKMDRIRKSTENEAFQSLDDHGSDDENNDHSNFALGLVKSNSVVARASMWQQLQQQAKGTPKPLLRHSRSKVKEGPSVTERFKTVVPIKSPELKSPPRERVPLAPSKSTANVLDRDEDANLDEDDPAKMSLADKMKMFNSKLTHKPPVAGLPRPRDDRVPRASRLRTMPVLASQVQEAMEQNERLTKSLTHEDVPRNSDFQLKMELFRSASAKNTSLEYLMRQNSKFRSLDLEDDSPSERAQRMITPAVRGILKSGSTVVPAKTKVLAKGESSEGLKDEGIDSSSDDESASASSVSSSEKSCSSSDSSDDAPGPKQRRFQQRKNNKLKSSKTDSDLSKLQDSYPRTIQLPCASEPKERIAQAKNPDVKIPLLGKLGRKPTDEAKIEDDKTRYRRFVKKLDEPIQLGKLRRPAEKTLSVEEKPVLKISATNQAAKNKFFGLEEKKGRSIDELAAAVRKYIPAVREGGASGSDGESSGGREVRRINTRRQRACGGVQRSATHHDMPHRGTTIADRLAALQAAGANEWRSRVCRLSPEREDSKAIERVKNQINESLNAAVDEKKKVQIDENELGNNILADRRNKLETAAQGWRKRVPQSDASLFTVAGRLERDRVTASTPPLSPPPLVTPPASAPASSPAVAPAVPPPNVFKSRKAPASPTNGFASGPLRSASCAVMGAAEKPKETPKIDRESFKRSHSVSESISRVDEKEELSTGAETIGCSVSVPRADDETFQAFFAPALQRREQTSADRGGDLDLDAIDSASRQLLSSECARRAKRERRHASRNPLRALAARTDLRQEYSAPPRVQAHANAHAQGTPRAAANCGLAAEALAALATKEDFSNVALRSASAADVPGPGTRPLMMMHVKGRRRVQTRLVEPVHSNVNRGDCFVLVTPDQLFLYIGLYANVIERNRSTDIAQHIYNTKDLGCKNSLGVIKIDEQTKNYSNKHWNQFWSLLGVAEGAAEYAPAGAGPPDEDEVYEACIVQTNMCYEVSDDELVPITEYWGQLPKIAMLHQSKVIVFDFGSEMYIWYGKNVPLESRRRAAQLARELFDDGYNYEDCHVNPVNAAAHQGARDEGPAPVKSERSRPEWAILSKVTQHMETILFKEKFLDWPDYSRVIKVKPQENKSSSVEINPCDAEEMWSDEYQDPDLVLEGSHVGRGTRYYDRDSMRHYDVKTKSVCKWVIREYDYREVEDETKIGEFFSGDSYIIRWEYQITVTGRELNGKPSKHNLTGRDRCAYFCWQGRDASSNEKGAAALLTVELDRERGPQLRIAQGNEPPAFLNLFRGNLVIHQGKKGTDKSRFHLYVTRGNVSNEAYLLQVPCSVRQLRSRGSLILVDTEQARLYVWHGSRSMKHTKQIAVELANKLVARKCHLFDDVEVEVSEVKEGEESKEFLDSLGVTSKQYYNSVLSGRETGDVTPRLFHFTDLGGQFEAHEVLSPLRHETLVTPFPFEQKELYSASQPALFLLDGGSCLWLWQGWWPRGEDGEYEPERNTGVGAFAGRWQAMRLAALRTAEAYWRVARGGARGGAGAGARPDVRVVAAGLEPTAFTDLFDTWTDHDEAADANIAHGHKAGAWVCGSLEASRLSSCGAVLPLAALQRRPLPDHVDPHHLERHLASQDFSEAFGMTKEEFSALPAWKQTGMKKDVGLF